MKYLILMLALVGASVSQARVNDGIETVESRTDTEKSLTEVINRFEALCKNNGFILVDSTRLDGIAGRRAIIYTWNFPLSQYGAWKTEIVTGKIAELKKGKLSVIVKNEVKQIDLPRLTFQICVK